MLPLYLQHKINLLGIQDFNSQNYLRVFQWIKHTEPSCTYNVLYHMHAIVNNIQYRELSGQQKLEIMRQYKLLTPSYPRLPANLINHYLQIAVANACNVTTAVPIGAIIVHNNSIIATACNDNDASHAELNALKQAQNKLQYRYLKECDLYVTLEPCLMCAGAIINSHIRRVIYGSLSTQDGAAISQYNVFDNINVNRHTEAIFVKNTRCTQLLQQFFCKLRDTKT